MNEPDTFNPGGANIVELTADVVSAYVSNNSVGASEIPTIIAGVYAALKALSAGQPQEVAEELKPAVSVRKSITPDYIISLEDGRKFKSMKRHIGLLGMTPDEYRVKWGLPKDYPMVAPNYSAKRSQLARDNGLGRKAAEVAAKGRRASRPKVG